MSTLQNTDGQQHYKYFAFISYSSKDVAWGRLLQRKLERYRLPARLASKRKDAPNRAYPIFRDETDLSGFKVRDALERELDHSRFLIVICSPQSAQSAWVNDEIQYFIDHGWEDRILPFIVEGTPYSADPSTECFPPALRNMSEDPLGVDVTALGKRKAFLRLVSALLDVKFDELLRRDTARRMRSSIALGFAGLLAAAALGFGIWYNTEHSKLYNAVTYQNEIPVGLYPLSKEEYSAATDSYRITTRRGKVIRLENVNSLGIVKTPEFSTATTDYPWVEYQYDDSGELITILQKDDTGKEVFRKDLSVNKETREIAIDFHSPNNALNIQALSADMMAAAIDDQDSDARSEITRQRNTYDENGYLIQTLYQRDNLGTAACDSNGVYGKRYEYNERGQVLRISNLNEHGQVYNCKYGWAYQTFTYDDRGNEIRSGYFDAQGNPARCREGYSISEVEYDEWDNPILWRSLDEKGIQAEGFNTARYTFDSRGMLVARAVFHPDGTPAYEEDGCHQYRITRDNMGRIYEVSFYDDQGNPFYSQGQTCAAYRTLRDAQGRVVELWKYDTRGQLIFNRSLGSYGQRSTYDEHGNRIRIEYLDEQGALMIASNGYAVSTAVYDENGRPVREVYLDEQEKPVRGTDNCAAIEITYDTFGNFSGCFYYDENGEPCYNANGYSSHVFVYKDGNLVSIAYFDTDGKPMLCANQYHELRAEYDKKGNPIRYSYHDTEGNLLNSRKRFAVTEQDYDSYGNLIAKRFFSAEMEPVSIDGYYAFTREYDSRGNVIREERAAFAPEQLNYMVMELSYDNRDNCIQERYLDHTGAPVVSETLAAYMNYTYDAHGNLLEMVWLDHNKQPKDAGDDGIENLRRQTFDAAGNKTLIQHLNRDLSGKETCLWQERYTYDAMGNCIRNEKLDGSGKPQMDNYGYATIVMEYSPRGFLIAEEHYDEKGQPCLYNNAVFRYEYTRTYTGRIAQMHLYGTDGQLLKESTGVAACICYEYDTRGLTVRKTYLNEKEEPFGTETDPVSYVEYFFDAMGYEIGSAYYAKDGTLVTRYSPYTCITHVNAGSIAEAAGLQAGDFLIELGDWCIFDSDRASPAYDLQAELTRTIHTQKQLVICRWADDDSFHFHRIHMPEGYAGYGVQTDTGDAKILERMENAYNLWLKENPQ